MSAPDETATPLFGSRSVAVHLLRGLTAAGLIALALQLRTDHPALASAAVLGALVFLRGCPMCWSVGLIETVLWRRRARMCACDPARDRTSGMARDNTRNSRA